MSPAGPYTPGRSSMKARTLASMTNQPNSAENSGRCQILKLDPEVSPCTEIGVSVRDPLTGNTELLCAAHLALRETHSRSS
jgi:hypothetical protein